jgi:hypothetical protein
VCPYIHCSRYWNCSVFLLTHATTALYGVNTSQCRCRKNISDYTSTTPFLFPSNSLIIEHRIIWSYVEWAPNRRIQYIINRKVKLTLCLICHEDVWGSGCIDQRFLVLGTSWRRVVNFTPLLIYLGEKSPRYPLDRRLGGPQSPFGRHGDVKILDPIGTRILASLSSNP